MSIPCTVCFYVVKTGVAYNFSRQIGLADEESLRSAELACKVAEEMAGIWEFRRGIPIRW